MGRTTRGSPLHNRFTRKLNGKNTKARSSIAKELFREGGTSVRAFPNSSKKKLKAHEPPDAIHKSSDSIAKARNTVQPRKYHWRQDDIITNEASALTIKEEKYSVNDDHLPSKSVASSVESDSGEDSEHNWIDGSTLIAQYAGDNSETEGERAIALVEYLKIPFQEKAHELKRDLCDALVTPINDIRQAHIRVDQDADTYRGKGIVYFNAACDRRHIEASHLQAELKDDLASSQAEIRQLLNELKQAYNTRAQLWVDIKDKVQVLTDLQASVLDQFDNNMARTVAALDKKRNIMLKEDSAKNKEKLLRGVLEKL